MQHLIIFIPFLLFHIGYYKWSCIHVIFVASILFWFLFFFRSHRFYITVCTITLLIDHNMNVNFSLCNLDISSIRVSAQILKFSQVYFFIWKHYSSLIFKKMLNSEWRSLIRNKFILKFFPCNRYTVDWKNDSN